MWTLCDVSLKISWEEWILSKPSCGFPVLLFVLLFSFLSLPALSIAGNADNFIFTGSATSSYSIEVPPGRKGVAPPLTLSYNSMGINVWLGIEREICR